MAANKTLQRARVMIELDRPRTLRFDFNALCLVEETLGISLAITSNPFTLGLRAIRALLYAGLKADDSDLTLDKCGEFYDEYDETMISRKLMEAWGVSFDDGDKDAQRQATGKNPPEPGGTGAQ